MKDGLFPDQAAIFNDFLCLYPVPSPPGEI
jgi:hypothetical protein